MLFSFLSQPSNSFLCFICCCCSQVFHILRPSKAPGFSFAWMELISHRVFIGRLLALTPQQRASVQFVCLVCLLSPGHVFVYCLPATCLFTTSRLHVCLLPPGYMFVYCLLATCLFTVSWLHVCLLPPGYTFVYCLPATCLFAVSWLDVCLLSPG